MEVNKMRSASVLLLAMLSAVLLSCISAQAYGGMPGDIAVPSMNVPNMDMPKPRITSPNMDMPETKPKTLGDESNNPSSNSIPATNQTGNTSSNQTQTTQIQQNQIQQKASPMDVSGKWSIKFDNGAERFLDLTLWSSTGAARVMGFGTLKEKGRENSVTAVGSVTEKELRLTTKLATPESANLEYDECNLELTTINGTLSGTYVLRSGGGFVDEGNATAVKQ